MPIHRILVTNDDGLHAPGLAALVASLATQFEVYVVAPDRERSGVGHGFTLFNPLRADEVGDRFPDGLTRKVYSCSGLPADCVKLGLLELFSDLKFDLVVSGINKGANMGTDVLYSGTVAGAREAILNGVPGLSTSLVTRGPGVEESSHPHFSTAADWTVKIIQELEDELIRGAREHYFLNLNVASKPMDAVREWVWTDLAESTYDDGYVRHQDPSGRAHYWLEGELLLERPQEGTDIVEVRKGRASVTPVAALAHAHGVLQRVR
jgi:5'-nucleotidase